MQPPQPLAPVSLRPMNVTEMIDASFRLYRANFVTFLGIVALLQVPMMIVLATMQYVLGTNMGLFFQQLAGGGAATFVPGPGQSWLDTLPIGQIATYIVALGGFGLVQGLIVNSLISGALANAIARSYLGQPTSIVDAYRFGAGRFAALVAMGVLLSLGSLLLSGILVGLPAGALVVLALRAVRDEANPGAIVLLALLLFAAIALLIVLFAFFGVRFLFGTQAVVLEGRGPVAGLRRSWALGRGSFWRVLGALALVSVLVYVLAGVPTQIVSFALQAVSRNQLDVIGRNQAILTLVSQISTMLVAPLQLTLFTLLYYDLRVRKEGYDLELRALHPVTS